MVDALQAVHRAVRVRGLLIDARPDGGRRPRIEAGGRVRGHLVQRDDATADDGAADVAVERVIARGLFRRIESGHIWHRSSLRDLAALDDYLENSPRYAGYARGTRARLVPFRAGPLLMRRAIKFQVLLRVR